MDLSSRSLSQRRPTSVALLAASGGGAATSTSTPVSSTTTATVTTNTPATGMATTTTTFALQPNQTAAATTSLQLLLREDPLLEEFGLTKPLGNKTTSGTTNTGSVGNVAFAYAAALLNNEDNKSDSGDAAIGSSRNDLLSTQHRADAALQDVERKLALVESLAVKLSRTSPEAVAGHFLRLHGYHVDRFPGNSETISIGDTTEGKEETPVVSGLESSTIVVTLPAIRDRSERLERQAETLDGIAKRVENSLTRGLTRMQVACTQLERTLELNAALKMILRLQFENSKLRNYDLEDLRDLTRAAASVAVLEELCKSQPEATQISIVQKLRPQVEATAVSVRKAAATMLQRQDGLPQLGATLQVYYHLGELPTAVWKAVDDAHRKAEGACQRLWNPVTLASLADQAKRSSKESRLVAKKLKELRIEAAQKWAQGVADAASQVRNLQRVLSRKTDPVQRLVFLDVVSQAPIPKEYSTNATASSQPFSLMALFWARVCQALSDTISSVIRHDHGKLANDISGLYPMMRASCLEMISRFHDTVSSASTLDDMATPGILGGSSALDHHLLVWNAAENTDNPQAAVSADSWTLPVGKNATSPSSSTNRASMSSVFSSQEWIDLQGSTTKKGLYEIQKLFLSKCKERLNGPLQYMFPDSVAFDDDGVALPTGTALLPSKYDVQRFDETIRQELALADPREGGGDFSVVTMIAECVVTVVSEFCHRAKRATTGAGEQGYVENWSPSESLQHDRKVVAIMYTLSNYLKSAAEKTFVTPYRPAILPQHEEAARLCQQALSPALDTIDAMITSSVVNPVCRALNSQISKLLAKIHHGVYLASSTSDDDATSFVQNELAPVFDLVAKNLLNKFPPPYSAVIASSLSTYTIYSFVSNVSLVRPIGESSRLHITQDLADLELTLDQFVAKSGGGGSLALSQIAFGRPYAELRAVRQMLFWSGLDMKTSSATELSKSLLREPWMKDVRASTVYHYLFASGPSLLSSPFHLKRMKAEEYVSTVLVQLDGSVQQGEDDAWITVVACCDAYQQRASSTTNTIADGDPRVAPIVMALGQELIRRRRN